jgi:peptidoglycan/LPS O-acetylase OafA/YrhL
VLVRSTNAKNGQPGTTDQTADQAPNQPADETTPDLPAIKDPVKDPVKDSGDQETTQRPTLKLRPAADSPAISEPETERENAEPEDAKDAEQAEQAEATPAPETQLAATRPISRVELRAMLATQPSNPPSKATKPEPEPDVKTDTEQPAPKKAWRAPGLDGVRALAVLSVLFFHESLPWIPGGFLGVDMFFVLSGFLITDILVAKFGRDGNVGLSTFWQRRARRLLPALGLMLLTVTAAVTVFEPSQRSTLGPALLGAVTYTSNWLQAFAHQSYFTLYGPPPVFQHLWSLAVEEQFYLIWPLLLAGILFVVRNRAVRIIIAWAIAIASALAMWAVYKRGSDPSLVYYGTDTHAFGLLAGAAIALTWPLKKVAAAAGKLRLSFDILGVIGLGVLAWSMWYLSGSNPFAYPYGLGIASLAAGGLVLAAAAPGWLGKALSWAPLRWLGVRSYGIYLWHWPVIAITVGLYPRGSGSIGAHVIDAVLPVGLAAASWQWLEEPILRNGFRAQVKRYWQILRTAPRTLVRTPLVTSPAIVGSLAVIALAGTAGYGLANTGSNAPSLQKQIENAQVIISEMPTAQTQTTYSTGQANPWWLKANGRRFKVIKEKQKPVHVLGSKIMMIGDSVMLASAPALYRVMPGVYVNAMVSRAMIAGIILLQQLKAGHQLRPIVIIGLGTNGPITLDQVNQLRHIIGPHRWLLLINAFEPRYWENEVNSTIYEAVHRYPNVMLINWHKAIGPHQNLLWSDDIHPMPIGGIFYAKVVRAVVIKALRHAPPTGRSRVPRGASGTLLHVGYARPS